VYEDDNPKGLAMTRPNLGRIGVWSRWSDLTPELAASLERLGYGALWIGGSPAGDLKIAERLLDATTTLSVATGIVNIWKDDARTVAVSFHRIEAVHPGRFLLGIGAGHREQIGDRYVKPYEALVRYLDDLDAARVPKESRALAALGPRVLRLAAERTAGAHPYFTTPGHTMWAREILGPGPLLAPEQKVVLVDDPARARSIARQSLRAYLGMINYTANFRRLGFGDEDLSGGGSDRLVDALIAHGDPATVKARIDEHLAAGADHVNIQLLSAPGADPLDEYRTLAEVLFA
jgi:probable F420-dependent oxidoreductase